MSVNGRIRDLHLILSGKSSRNDQCLVCWCIIQKMVREKTSEETFIFWQGQKVWPDVWQWDTSICNDSSDEAGMLRPLLPGSRSKASSILCMDLPRRKTALTKALALVWFIWVLRPTQPFLVIWSRDRSPSRG